MTEKIFSNPNYKGVGPGSDGKSEVDIVIGAANRVRENLANLEQKRLRLEHSLRESMFDSLTNCPDKEWFKQIFVEKVFDYTKDDEALGVIFVDFNNLKRTNDISGHKAGDELLKRGIDVLNDGLHCLHRQEIMSESSNIIENSPDDKNTELIAKSNIITRFGGDEFVILYHSEDGKYGLELIDEMREKMSAALDDKKDVDLSFGVAVYSEHIDDSNLYNTIERSDKRMYDMKNHRIQGHS